MRTAVMQQLIAKIAGHRGEARPPAMQNRMREHIAVANAAAIVVYPDEEQVLMEICRRIDEEQDPAPAWRKVSDIESTGVFDQPRELEELQWAVAHNALRSTVAYINMSTGKAATGNLIEIGDRVFMATTAHSVPWRPASKLSFIGQRSTKIGENIPTILCSGRADDDRFADVAFVELETRYVEEQFGKAALPLSRLHPCGPGQEGHWTFVSGYPTEHIQVERLPRERVHLQKFTMQTWGFTILPPAQWAVLQDSCRAPDPDLDVFLPYPRSDDIVSLGPLKADHLVEPYGMSGGGFWQPVKPTTGGVWTPDRYALIAIQSRWWGLGRYLQATQIIHWLRLVWAHRPELRSMLEAQFPTWDLSSASDPPESTPT